MAKSENKTKPEKTSVTAYINAIEDQQVKDDCMSLVKILGKLTGEKAVMWGTAIVGFGSYHYRYESGREGDSCLTGFSPRKGNISIYTNSYLNEDDPLMKKLGKYKHGKSCLYVKKLSDIDISILEKIIAGGIKHLQARYPS
jgi:hypothetical protein